MEAELASPALAMKSHRAAGALAEGLPSGVKELPYTAAEVPFPVLALPFMAEELPFWGAGPFPAAVLPVIGADDGTPMLLLLCATGGAADLKLPPSIIAGLAVAVGADAKVDFVGAVSEMGVAIGEVPESLAGIGVAVVLAADVCALFGVAAVSAGVGEVAVPIAEKFSKKHDFAWSNASS